MIHSKLPEGFAMRRFQLSAVGAASASGWFDLLAARAAEKPLAPKAKAKQCILLGVDTEVEFQIGERPVRAVDKGANPIKELW